MPAEQAEPVLDRHPDECDQCGRNCHGENPWPLPRVARARFTASRDRSRGRVGIATLYRHFPNRESLVDAIYRDQVVRLTTGARELLGQLDPAAAMRRWMDLWGTWIGTENGMLDTLLAMIESGETAHSETQTSSWTASDLRPPLGSERAYDPNPTIWKVSHDLPEHVPLH